MSAQIIVSTGDAAICKVLLFGMIGTLVSFKVGIRNLINLTKAIYTCAQKGNN